MMLNEASSGENVCRLRSSLGLPDHRLFAMNFHDISWFHPDCQPTNRPKSSFWIDPGLCGVFGWKYDDNVKFWMGFVIHVGGEKSS